MTATLRLWKISIHALREEGDLLRQRLPPHYRHFYPRPPRGGRPSCLRLCSIRRSYFYPRPPRGGRLMFTWTKTRVYIFLSTPSARRATGSSLCRPRFVGNFYPRPPRGGRRWWRTGWLSLHRISIHALREEGDFSLVRKLVKGAEFLSTPSARRATTTRQPPSIRSAYFYPRPPRGGRLIAAYTGIAGIQFLSTPSARRATHQPIAVARLHDISIHALREEGDCAFWRSRTTRPYFYPRPPRGGRLNRICANRVQKIFLSTPSARRATLVF